jgi:prevent-host-death family protein
MIVPATEFKNRLGQYIDAARTNPVVVEKTGRKTAVLISIEEFERLTKTEDEFWAQKALAAEKEGYWKQRDKNQPKSPFKNQPPLITGTPVRVR